MSDSGRRAPYLGCDLINGSAGQDFPAKGIILFRGPKSDARLHCFFAFNPISTGGGWFPSGQEGYPASVASGTGLKWAVRKSRYFSSVKSRRRPPSGSIAHGLWPFLRSHFAWPFSRDAPPALPARDAMSRSCGCWVGFVG